MTYKVWNGQGEIQPGEAYFTKNDGQIVGRPYVRQRASRALARFRRGLMTVSRDTLQACLARTVDNDEWLGCRNGYLVAAICRDVVDNLLGLARG